ncbi:MAG: hypothetical protein ACLTQQ_09550, partial [Oscillospiraceae bacterium]
MRKIPLPAVKNSAQKGRWLNASARKGKTPGSNRGRRSETAICIYGLKEEIRARKSPETVDAPGFSPDASTVSLICKGRLKSIFLFLVQKVPQLIKQGRSAQCQLPVLG